MTDFIDKYILPIAISLTLSLLAGVSFLLKYFVKTNFSDKMKEFQQSILTFRKNIDELKAITDSTVTNIERIIFKFEELMDKLDDVELKMENRFEILDKKIERVEEKVHEHSEQIATITATHNVIHSEKITKKHAR